MNIATMLAASVRSDGRSQNQAAVLLERTNTNVAKPKFVCPALQHDRARGAFLDALCLEIVGRPNHFRIVNNAFTVHRNGTRCPSILTFNVLQRPGPR
jgi:hypothetical protein